MDRVILKLSGEALSGDRNAGIDPKKIKDLALEIKEAQELNLKQIGVVVGGGNFFRGRDAKDLGMDRIDCDYMGMIGTLLNALALKDMLLSLGAKVKVLTSLEVPEAIELYNKEDAINYLEEGNIVIFAGGTGRPLFSTDTAALLKATDINAKEILMAKNGVDGVYDDDPKINPNAKKYDILTHKDVLTNSLQVMDMTAASIADTNDIDIVVFDIASKDAIKKAIKNEKIGTLIKKEIK